MIWLIGYIDSQVTAENQECCWCCAVPLTYWWGEHGCKSSDQFKYQPCLVMKRLEYSCENGQSINNRVIKKTINFIFPAFTCSQNRTTDIKKHRLAIRDATRVYVKNIQNICGTSLGICFPNMDSILCQGYRSAIEGLEAIHKNTKSCERTAI